MHAKVIWSIAEPSPPQQRELWDITQSAQSMCYLDKSSFCLFLKCNLLTKYQNILSIALESSFSGAQMNPLKHSKEND